MTNTTPTKKFLKAPIIWVFIIACALALVLFFRPTTHKDVIQDDGEPQVYKKVVYDVANWQARPIMTEMGQDRFERAKTFIAQTATKSDALDFHGVMADKYSHTSAHEPPLYVIESDELFELTWYYAHPKDSDAIKQASYAHAQKAYALATALYGNDGKAVLENMLAEQEIKTELLQTHGILKAECVNYTCQLIMKK